MTKIHISSSADVIIDGKPVQYIKILTNSDFDLEPNEFNHPKIRLGARGVILNSDGKIAILNKANNTNLNSSAAALRVMKTPSKPLQKLQIASQISSPQTQTTSFTPDSSFAAMPLS